MCNFMLCYMCNFTDLLCTYIVSIDPMDIRRIKSSIVDDLFRMSVHPNTSWSYERLLVKSELTTQSRSHLAFFSMLSPREQKYIIHIFLLGIPERPNTEVKSVKIW